MTNTAATVAVIWRESLLNSEDGEDRVDEDRRRRKQKLPAITNVTTMRRRDDTSQNCCMDVAADVSWF